MFAILVSSFVIACAVATITSAAFVLRHGRQQELVDEIVAEPVQPEWIYGPRMDVPSRYPLLRTRNSKALR